MPLAACPACGCRTFFLHESEVWLSSADACGRLACRSPDRAIDAIACERCGAEYGADEFAQIDFG